MIRQNYLKIFFEVFKLEGSSYTIEQGKNNLEKFINKWKKIYTRIGQKFKEADLENYFAYLNFPSQIHRMIYSTNWIDRLHNSIRKTQRRRLSFPNVDSVLNLICAFIIDREEKFYNKYPVTAFYKVKDKLDILFNKL